MVKNSQLHPTQSNSEQVGSRGEVDGKVAKNKDKSSEHDDTTSIHISRKVCLEKTGKCNKHHHISVQLQ